MSKKAYIFLADGFEDIEGLTVVDLLRRAGIDIKTVSIKETTQIQTSHGITMLTDTTFTETSFTDADILVLPGGMPGTKYLAAYKPLTDLLTDFNNKGKKIAAICAAPSILGEMGLLKGRTATCYPGFEDKLEGVSYTRQGVITDGNITTARGLGYALDLGIELIRLLMGPQHAQMVKDSIQYDQV